MPCSASWGRARASCWRRCRADWFDDASFPFGTSREVAIGRATVRATRITYVGELGWELYVPTDLAAGRLRGPVPGRADLGVVPAGYYAIESMRLEKGYRAFARELTTETGPVVAGLTFACKLRGPTSTSSGGRPWRPPRLRPADAPGGVVRGRRPRGIPVGWGAGAARRRAGRAGDQCGVGRDASGPASGWRWSGDRARGDGDRGLDRAWHASEIDLAGERLSGARWALRAPFDPEGRKLGRESQGVTKWFFRRPLTRLGRGYWIGAVSRCPARTSLPHVVLRPASGNAFEATVEQLASAIRLGVFTDGTQLPPERELADRLGVSRTPCARRSRRCASPGWSPRAGARRRHASSPTPGGAGHRAERAVRTGAALADALDFRRVVEPGRPRWPPPGPSPPTSAPGCSRAPRQAPRGAGQRRPPARGQPAAPGHRDPVRLAEADRGGDPGPGGPARDAHRDPGAAAATSSTPTTSTTPSSRPSWRRRRPGPGQRWRSTATPPRPCCAGCSDD